MSSVGQPLACLFAVLIASGPSVTHADDSVTESEHDIQRGIELRLVGENREALDLFERACSLHPTPRGTAQVALAHQALADWVDAERGLNEALAASDDPWIIRYHDALESARATVRAHLGWIHVETDPPSAELTLDDKSTFRLPLAEPIRVVAGTRELEVHAPGRVTARREIVVSPSARVEVVIALEQHPGEVLTPPDGSARTATNDPAERTPVNRPTAAYVALTAAGLFAVGGVVAWRVREDNAAVYNDNSRCLVASRTREEQCGSYAETANVALGLEIGAFALAGASVGFATWRLSAAGARSSGVSALTCTPWGGLGVGCRGRF